MSGKIHIQSKIGNVLILITKGRGYTGGGWRGTALEGTGLPPTGAGLPRLALVTPTRRRLRPETWYLLLCYTW